jgi:cell wall-associated NlpC family hydrolase
MLPGDGSGFDMPTGQDVAALQQRYDHEMHAWSTVLGVDLQSGKGIGGPNQEALQTFLNSAVAQRGDAYVFGAKGTGQANPTAFDCSGLTKWAAEQAGIELPDGAAHQYIALKQAGMIVPVDKAENIPGALLFHFAQEPQPGDGEPPVAHVAISLGNGKTIEAMDPQDGVTESHSAGRFEYAAIIPGIGTDSAPAGHRVVEYAPGEAVPPHHPLTQAELLDLESGHGHLDHTLTHSFGHPVGAGGFDDPFGLDPGPLHDDGTSGSGWDFGSH